MKTLYTNLRRKWQLAQMKRAENGLASWVEARLGVPCTLTRLNRKTLQPRITFRVNADGGSYIAHWSSTARFATAFARIGGHLRDKGVAVPAIVQSDPRHRFFLMEDVGGPALGALPAALFTPDLYLRVAEAFARLQKQGTPDFDQAWCCEPVYDRREIVSYTVRRLRDWLGTGLLGLAPGQFAAVLADVEQCCRDAALDEGPFFLNHSDTHFNNLVVRSGEIVILDWEHASLRPLPMDLANLLTYPLNRDIWQYREIIIPAYLRILNLTEAQTEVFLRQLPCLEACFLVRRLTYVKKRPAPYDASLARVIHSVFRRETMQTYPAMSDLMMRTAALLERGK